MAYEVPSFEEMFDRMFELLSGYQPGLDSRENSPVWLCLAPLAEEMAELYNQLAQVLDESFADTASRENLIRRAAERGISPHPASQASISARVTPAGYNILGERFSINGVNYDAITETSAGVWTMLCVSYGELGNISSGRLIPINYLDGLELVEIIEILIPGEEEEDTEVFRQRYFNSLESQAFGGNRQDYREKVTAIAGVGGVKAYRTPAGGGTVGLTIIASDWSVPSTTLVDLVQETIDPPPQAEGMGTAPIGHTVTVKACNAVTVNVETTFTYQDGWDEETTRAGVITAIEAYFRDLAISWSETLDDGLIVRTSQLDSRLLNVAGILDVTDTKLNGDTANLELERDDIPVRGTVNGVA